MRIFTFVLALLLTIITIWALNKSWGPVPAMGAFLSPQHGIWQNAESSKEEFSQELKLPQLSGNTTVYLDDRLVPHVFADNDNDLYFVQGWLHAKFRLWQMEFQTHAAAGRVSEIIGANPDVLKFDRQQRRLGMTYAAQNALMTMEADQESIAYLQSYSDGVNAYINSLTDAQLPLEYKLLGYKPEPWSLYKTALFLKMMSKTLAGYEKDLELTNMRQLFTHAQLQVLFPQLHDSTKPIIPVGTAFAPAAINPVKPASADSLYFGTNAEPTPVEIEKPNPSNGSNNWALAGTKTATGAPILCNDPHLELSFPSIWYEMQLTSPTVNSYGATFPGSPSIIIGFNDNIAFGFTNAGRDVKDYYRIKFKDGSKQEYWFDSAWQKSRMVVEEIKVKGAPVYYDTVAYTVFGPVMYDASFSNKITGEGGIAVQWIAHQPSNEAAMWFKLNRAKNYNDYLAAIKDFKCPAQNMLFASKSGDIAIWQQGLFPARWQGQGMYVMPGEDSSYVWQGYIPQDHNPHVVNPAEGFIQSANQRPVDAAYPYYIPGGYISPRGVTAYNKLSAMQGATVEDMMQLQQDYYSSYAADVLPKMIGYLKSASLNATEQQWLDTLKRWDYITAPQSVAATVYQAWLDSLKAAVWNDEMIPGLEMVVRPESEILADALLSDSAFAFVDDIQTLQKENWQSQVAKAFHSACDAIDNKPLDSLQWSYRKGAHINHLLRTVKPLARKNLITGGWGNTLNAITTNHGPSWRMIVQLTQDTEAYVIYPGGQSGNPGSKYYDNAVDDWVVGKYYKLWMMKRTENNDNRVRHTITFSKA